MRRSAAHREAPLACRPLEASSTISSPGASASPSSGSPGGGTKPSALPASSISSQDEQVDERGRLAPAPRALGVVAGAAPPGKQRVGALGVLVPRARAGGEVGVDDERQSADADQVVEDGGDGVVGDVVEAVDAGELVVSRGR